jgi:hypothetical protein
MNLKKSFQKGNFRVILCALEEISISFWIASPGKNLSSSNKRATALKKAFFGISLETGSIGQNQDRL